MCFFFLFTILLLTLILKAKRTMQDSFKVYENEDDATKNLDGLQGKAGNTSSSSSSVNFSSCRCLVDLNAYALLVGFSCLCLCFNVFFT